MSRLWLFNLDAEDELAGRPAFGIPAEAVERLARPLADGTGGFLAAGDVALDGAGQPGASSALRGVAWCPTPAAVRRLERAGAAVDAPPDLDVLRRANARETFAHLDPLSGAGVVRDMDELRRAVSVAPPKRAPDARRASAWLLRRSLGAAGRGRLVAERWDGRVEGWAASALAEGAVHVAPLVDVADELALHGRVALDGEVALGRPVRHRAQGGTFRSAALAPPGSIDPERAERLLSAASEVGAALAELGYHGPFGVDAFEWTDGRGARRFHAPSEVNARYTMSFAIGAPELV
ncbi:MAG: hypothetical protein AAF957_15680 [Planctomycetota bacterium]